MPDNITTLLMGTRQLALRARNTMRQGQLAQDKYERITEHLLAVQDELVKEQTQKPAVTEGVPE